MAEWMLPCGVQCRMGFCPCLFQGDMCEHTGDGFVKGCLTGCLCPCCFQIYMGPKIAEMSGISHNMSDAVVNTCCCGPCYGQTIAIEYLKQVKDKGQMVSNNQWVMDIKQQLYAGCCPCMVGMDMFKHAGIEPSILGCCFNWACITGPKIAEKGGIPETCGMAVLKCLCVPCYGTTVYTEYLYQKNKGGSPKQQQMAVAVGVPQQQQM